VNSFAMPKRLDPNDMAAHHIVLIGLMGSGKSTIGRQLAAALERPFVDTDIEIEKSQLKTIPQIFHESGEEGFRNVEEEVLVEQLNRLDDCVLATGGGIVEREVNRNRLHNHHVVWLRAEVETLAQRVEKRPHDRPLLGDDPRGRLFQLNASRSPLYAEVARLVVDVDGRSTESIVDSIVANAFPISQEGQ